MVKVHVYETKNEQSKYYFVESVPADCHFPPTTRIYPKIGESVIKMLSKAKVSVKAVSFYFTLRAKDVEGGPFKTADVGEEIYRQLQEAAKRGVSIHLLANLRGPKMESIDMMDLHTEFPDKVNIGDIDMSKKTPGFTGGICHTKLWIIDDKYFYVGSSNMDWRSYTEIVETGIVGKNQSYVMEKLNALYLESARSSTDSKFVEILLERCPQSYPMKKNEYLTYLPVKLSCSPYWFGRKHNIRSDKLALLEVINTAQKKLYLTSYEYSVFDPFSTPKLLDLSVEWALKNAAFVRKVEINIILDAKVIHMKSILHNLQNLMHTKGITIKTFLIKNKSKPDIPFAKLWHSKLAVSESKVWISTNNIIPSYFELTCGAGILFDATTNTYKDQVMPLVDSAADHFMRYWNSEYCEDLPAPEEPSVEDSSF